VGLGGQLFIIFNKNFCFSLREGGFNYFTKSEIVCVLASKILSV